MALLKNKNFAFSLLAADLLIDGLSITVTSGEGVRFPATGNFMGVLWAGASASPGMDANREIVLATLISGDTFSITRAQEGTAAKAWSTAANFACVFSAGKMDELETYLQNGNMSYIPATGTNNYTCTFDPAVTAYVSGSSFNTVFTNASTGSVTLAANSLAAKKVYGLSGTSYIQLISGMIPAGFYANLLYDTSLDGGAGGWICTNIDAAVVSGVKTFALSPIVPIPTTDYQAVPMKFVVDEIADINTELVNDTTPELGGPLDLNENNIIYNTSGTYVTSVEFGYLDGVTSEIQTQLNNRGKLDGAQVWEKAQSYDVQALSISSGVMTWNVELYPVATITLSQNITSIVLQNAVPGASYEITFTQDGTGSRTVTFPTAWQFPAKTNPTITAAANSIDIVSLSVIGTIGTPVVRGAVLQNMG